MFGLSVMLIGLLALTLDIPSLAFVSSLVLLLSLGKPRSNALSLIPLSRLSIAACRSMAATNCELKWISFLLRDFGIAINGPILFRCDSQAALHIMANPVFNERIKHLDTDCHVVRDAYKGGFLAPIFIRSKDQLADLFTKSLSIALFSDLVYKLGLFLGSPSPTCGGLLRMLTRIQAITQWLMLIQRKQHAEDAHLTAYVFFCFSL
ncbi:UNVERIFIED_CONTAM: hypothetical protein Sindi_0384400 [Sesamum indicum]